MLIWCLLALALAALWFSVTSRKSFEFHVKFVLVYIWVFTNSALLFPFFFIKPRNVKNLTHSMKILKYSAQITGTNYELRGEEQLSKERTCVIVANHQSAIDLIAMFKIWHVIDKMTVIAKREILYAGWFGIAAYMAGLTFINRKSGTAGQAMNEALEGLKEKRVKLWVFPEGTRRNTGEIHQFKKGAFHAAIYAQVPIVPVVISSYKGFLDTKLKIFNSGKVIVHALPEIPTVGMKPEDIEKLMEMSRSAMIKKFDELNSEVGSKIN